MNHFDFIDIGTSDFRYTIPKESQCGLYIEPLQFYLDSIPEYKNCFKECCAIADHEGFIKINYIHPSVIKKYKLPNWLRGCNSILDSPHPSAIRVLNSRKISHAEAITSTQIKSLTILDIYEKYNISSVDSIKIDTEGYDCYIVNQILKSPIHPNIIIFESNLLTDNSMFQDTLKLLLKNGFSKKYITNIDSCFIKNNDT